MGWAWEGGKRGSGICIQTTDSLCYTAETNTTLYRNYAPIYKSEQNSVEQAQVDIIT